MKTYWKLYNKSENELDNKSIKYYRGFNEYTTQQNIIDLGLQSSEELSQAYDIYQTILKTVRNKDYSTLNNLLNNYQRTNSSLDTTINTLKKNRKYIQNSLVYKYSNGPIEGINRKIKTLKRTSYGFRNQKNFFTRIQLILK